MEPNFALESKRSSSGGGGCPKGKVPIKRMNNSSLLHSDHFHQFNSEYPGEHVHPKIYGDGRTYLTVFWTADSHIKTGCYNMICPGFVQVNAHLYPGQPIDSVSVNGGQQYIIDLKIYQDQTSKNWWLISGDTKIGYWPKELFNYLVNGGFVFRYGGRTTNGQDGTSPPMGSGHYATKLTDQSCFFSKMKLLNWGLSESDIPSHLVKVNVDSLNCYTLNYLSFQDQQMGQVLTFGGPGGNCGV